MGAVEAAAAEEEVAADVAANMSATQGRLISEIRLSDRRNAIGNYLLACIGQREVRENVCCSLRRIATRERGVCPEICTNCTNRDCSSK